MKKLKTLLVFCFVIISGSAQLFASSAIKRTVVTALDKGSLAKRLEDAFVAKNPANIRALVQQGAPIGHRLRKPGSLTILHEEATNFVGSVNQMFRFPHWNMKANICCHMKANLKAGEQVSQQQVDGLHHYIHSAPEIAGIMKTASNRGVEAIPPSFIDDVIKNPRIRDHNNNEGLTVLTGLLEAGGRDKNPEVVEAINKLLARSDFKLSDLNSRVGLFGASPGDFLSILLRPQELDLLLKHAKGKGWSLKGIAQGGETKNTLLHWAYFANKATGGRHQVEYDAVEALLKGEFPNIHKQTNTLGLSVESYKALDEIRQQVAGEAQYKALVANNKGNRLPAPVVSIIENGPK